MEIGSIYEVDPGLLRGENADASGKDGQGVRLRETEKYRKKYIRYTGSGREAIALALKSLVQDRPEIRRVCLLPAYMCDTVFFPFEREGWKLCFYPVEKDLTVKKEILLHRIREAEPGLLFIHPYYGVDTWRSVRPLFPEWQAQGICIMEDVTQSYYLESAGKEADYVVGSLRKWYPVPDGGFAASNRPLSASVCGDDRYFTEQRLALLTQKWNYLYGEDSREKKRALKAAYLTRNLEMERWLDGFDGVNVMSPETALILEKTDEEACRSRREKNCRFLDEKLAGKKFFRPVLNMSGERQETKDGTAPLYYPIYADRRDELQAYLRERDIYAPVLWPVGKENEDELSDTDKYVFEHMLALPMDQRYKTPEMERIVQVLEEYERDAGEVIGIRADANETVATGHIMRCITIAGQLKKRGRRVVFFTADGYADAMLEEAGMEHVCLHTKWNRMEEETELLKQKIKESGCKKLLVDSYRATPRYFEELRAVCPLIYIDDCFEAVYPVDLLINYNAYCTRFPYRETYEKEGGTQLLLGTAYVPLREEFAPEENSGSSADKSAVREGTGRRAPKRLQVLLASGGGDSYNALTGVLETFFEKEPVLFQSVDFHVITGRFNKNETELQRLARQHENVFLHINVSRMAGLMGECDGAVSAAGTMLFELSAVQVPTVFFISADNQKYDGEFFAARERMLYGGDMRMGREEALEGICRQLKILLQDDAMRQRMRETLREVTDGRGAARIAEAIIRL